MIYIVKHSKSCHIICSKKYLDKVKKLESDLKINIGFSLFNNSKLEKLNNFKNKLVKNNSKITPNHEASLIYTSGTTGNPKGCILSHFYEINAGYSYINKKGFISLQNEKEKIYNCLPVHHVNSGILSFFAILLSGNCQIQAERFSVSRFWKEIKYSKATLFHYLGVMVPLLLKKISLLEKK